MKTIFLAIALLVPSWLVGQAKDAQPKDPVSTPCDHEKELNDIFFAGSDFKEAPSKYIAKVVQEAVNCSIYIMESDPHDHMIDMKPADLVRVIHLQAVTIGGLSELWSRDDDTDNQKKTGFHQ